MLVGLLHCCGCRATILTPHSLIDVPAASTQAAEHWLVLAGACASADYLLNTCTLGLHLTYLDGEVIATAV